MHHCWQVAALAALILQATSAAQLATHAPAAASPAAPPPRAYLYFPSSDVLLDNETIFPRSSITDGSVAALSALCDATPTCVAFNLDGWLKNATSSLAPFSVDTYVLAPVPPPPAPLLLWPAPRGSASAGAAQLVVPPSLAITTEPAGSADLDAAIVRFRAAAFGAHAAASPPAASLAAATLRALTLRVANVSVPLQLGVDESYAIAVPADGSAAVITAPTVYGAYHALESLAQLLTFDAAAGAYWLPAPLALSDAPRFSWRGLMVDPARHYLPLRTLRAIVDSMTAAKLNVLHMHVVDCESWPLEVPGAFAGLWAAAFSPRERYTLADLAALVEYARARGVRVIFEHDTPGHAASMCVAHPELCPAANCTEPLSPASAATLPALQAVIDALVSVAPDDVLHLGGDEVNPACWAASPAIRAWMEEQHMNSTDQIYEWFVEQTNAMALAANRSPMRWEEVWKHFRTALDRRTIIHAWLSSDALSDAVNNGYRAVFSVDTQAYYLDYLGVQWDAVYATDILAGVPNVSAHELVLGGELAMWGETVDAGTLLPTVWPRAAAAAERLWSGTTNKQTSATSWDVVTRLAAFRCALLERGVPAASLGNAQAGSMGPAWTVGSCGGGYRALC